MFKDPRVWTAVVAAGIAAWLLGPYVLPARPPVVAEETIPEIRYVCRESGEVFTQRMTGDVLDHPKTGKPTLVPAVYDKKTKSWKPGPRLEIMHKKGLIQPAS
jgi:hypothetical protein